MKKIVFIISALMLITTFGCESDETTNPVASAEYQIVLENLPDSLVWLAGEAMTIPVNALVLNKEGSLAPGVRVEFAVTSESGEFDSPGNVSDQHGRVSAVATLTPEEGWQEFSPLLIVPGGSAGGRVAVQGIRQPSRIAFVALNTTFKVGQGGIVETSFKAIFSDEDGVGIAGLPVRISIESGGGGYISTPPMTNDAGEVTVLFNSAGYIGRVDVTARSILPGMSVPVDSTLTLEIERLTDDIGSITIRVSPDFFNTPHDSLVVSEIRILVLDLKGVGLADVVVDLETDLGSLTRVTATDEDGIATAEWHNDYQDGLAHIIASVPGTGYEAIAVIAVRTIPWEFPYIQVSSDLKVIHVSNGLEKAIITAVRKDSDNQAMSANGIIFSSTFGVVTPSVYNEGGSVARAEFTDIGLPSVDGNGNSIPAVIYARYPSLGLVDSVLVTILPRNPVRSITISSNKERMGAGSGEMAWIEAIAIMQNGAYASSGTSVNFEVAGNNGMFRPHTAIIGGSGTAYTEYIAGNFIGTAELFAYIEENGDSACYSNVLEIDLLPGPPNNVRVSANPTELFTNDPNTFSTITAIVTDTAGNPVQAGTLVRFATTMGDITPSAITNDNGIAFGRLTPGVSAGVAEVTATVNLVGGVQVIGNATVTFTAGNPNTITLTADPEELNVSECPIYGSTLTARVFDPNGNPIGRSAIVVFRILNQPPPPNGCSFSNGTQIDSARTANGVARMSLNAGYYIGGVLVKAYTWRDPDTRRDTIDVINNRIQVVAGPPCAVQIDYSTAGEDVGGGMWKIPVTARVFDNHLNPVPDGIPVMFTVIPDDIASITNGRTENGFASVDLFYHSSKTYEEAMLQAEVEVANGQILAQREMTLPLQQGRLTFHCDPANWRFDRDNPDDTCLIRTWAILTDGHGILINNAPILFSTDRAQYYWRNQVGGRYVPFYPNPARQLTGIDNDNMADPPGFATVYLRGTMNDFFLEDETLETRCNVWAQVEGLDVIAEPRVVMVTRR